MANDEPRNEIRTMDLNLYLGLPHRRPEPDLGSDLALASTILHPLSQEMSTSINNNNQSQSVSLPPPGEIVHNSLHDLEYNPYSPSYAQISPTPQPRLNEQQQRTLGIDHPPYLPAYAEASSSPTAQDSTEAVLLGGGSSSNNDIEYVPYPVPPYVPALSSSLPVETSELLQLQVQEDDNNNAHVPYNPASPIIEVNNSNDHSSSRPEVTGFCPYQDVQDGSGLQRVLLQCPEFRFRRLIEANRRLGGIRRFRSSTGVGSDLGMLLPGPPSGFHDVRDPEGSVATNSASQKGNVEGLAAEDLEEEETKERSSGAANFDCNVCLDVAKEPVVTSCGHLFCWPCLYQWLYLHSDHKECPVCKGEVIESNITPIFGRGSSEREVEKKEDDDGQGDSSLKIPPRPRGRRVESLRQRFRRPLLRRLREEIGSWRFIIDDEMHRQVEGLPEEQSVPPGFIDRRTLTRFMAARFHREDNLENGLNLGGSGSSSNVAEMANGENLPDGLHGLGSRSIPPALARRGIDFWRRFASYSFPSDRLAAIAADLSNMVGRRANGSNNSDASASTSVNPPPDPDYANIQRPLEATVAADQASASSTIAVIQGDTGVPVDAPAEPNSAGSSRVLRRRRRNATSGSLDVDGVHPASKRRRLN